MLRFFILVLYLVCTWSLSGQSQMPSDNELISFTKVYLQEHKGVSHFELETQKVLRETGMSNERYGQILRAQFTGELIEYSDNDKKAIAALNELKQKLEKNRLVLLEEICRSENMTIARYEQLSKEMNTNLKMKQKCIAIIEQKLKVD